MNLVSGEKKRKVKENKRKKELIHINFREVYRYTWCVHLNGDLRVKPSNACFHFPKTRGVPVFYPLNGYTAKIKPPKTALRSNLIFEVYPL